MVCWWRARAVWVLATAWVLAGAASARGESILKLDQGSKAKTPVNTTFSLRPMPVKDDSNLDRAGRFVLAPKKEQPPTLVVDGKKKASIPAVEWNEKNAKKVKQKELKLPKKPPKHEPAPPHVQWAQVPTPMAPAAMELGASVPAPQSLWGGLAIMAGLGIWRWFAARGARAI